jgi:hypothetical protein
MYVSVKILAYKVRRKFFPFYLVVQIFFSIFAAEINHIKQLNIYENKNCKEQAAPMAMAMGADDVVSGRDVYLC